MRIETKDADGKENGYVLPIWNARESDYRPDQVYVTVIAPHTSKGPHLHKKRIGRFACIDGNAVVITRVDGQYETHRLGAYNSHEPLIVPAGVPCQIVNEHDRPAVLINMPSPGWSQDDQDEWPVEDWKPCAA